MLDFLGLSCLIGAVTIVLSQFSLESYGTRRQTDLQYS